MIVKITNWDVFQHYQNRRPPWIKLHRQLLENRHWHQLGSDASKLLVECWLIASDNSDGTIHDDVEDLAFRLHREASTILPLLQELVGHGFIQIETDDASEVLAQRLQVAVPETETEGETKKRERVVYSEFFEELWQIHRSGSKKNALPYYKKAIKIVSHEELKDALLKYTRTFSKDFKGMHLARWLKDHRWEEQEGAGQATDFPTLQGWSPPALQGK